MPFDDNLEEQFTMIIAICTADIYQNKYDIVYDKDRFHSSKLIIV